MLFKQIILPFIILGCVFVRPFICDIAFENIDFILSIIFIFFSLLYLLKHIKQLSLTTLDKIIIIFGLSLLISILFSSSSLNSLFVLYKYIFSITLFYTVKLISREHRKSLIIILLTSSIIVSLYSLRCLFIVSKFILKYFSEYNINYLFAKEFFARGRAFFPFLSPNLLANYLTMIIIFCLGVTLSLKNDKKKYLFFIGTACVILNIAALFFTKSIGGWLTLFLSIFIFFLGTKTLNRKSLSIILLIILTAAAVFFVRSQGGLNFTKPLFSAEKRISYWKETITIISQHPLTGVGIGNLSLKDTMFTHNSYLQIWAEIGLPGIISWLGIIFIFLKNCVNNLSDSKNNFFYAGLLSGGAAFLLHNTFDFSFFSSQVSFLWWIILALNDDNTHLKTILTSV